MGHLPVSRFARINWKHPCGLVPWRKSKLAAGERGWRPKGAPRFQSVIVANRAIRGKFTFKFVCGAKHEEFVRSVTQVTGWLPAEEPWWGNGRSIMTQQSSLQPVGRVVGGPPDSLVRLATAALVRLATAALALVVAMLVINPLASGRPLTWATLSPPVPAHSQPPSVGVRLFDANGAATANNDGYLEGLAKAVSYP